MPTRALFLIYDDRSIVDRCLALALDLVPDVEPLFLVRYPRTRRWLKEMGFPALLIGETLGWEHKLPCRGSPREVFGVPEPPETWKGISLAEATRFERRLAALQGDEAGAQSALTQAGEIVQRFLSLAAWWRPAFIVCWNGWTLPWSVARALGWKHGAFVVCTERGLLPDSLVLDTAGVNAGSYLTGEKWRSISQRAPRPDERAWAEQLRARYAAERRTVVSAGPAARRHDVRQELGVPDEATVVLCPAQLDEDTDPVLFAPEFPTNASVLKALGETARGLGRVFILFKTHPEDLGPRQDYSRHLQGIGAVIDDLALHDLFDAADVVVTRNSAVGFEGLLLGKPVIALGRALWTDKGFTHDVRTPAELDAALAAVRAEPGLSPEQDDLFIRFLVYLLCRYHYYLDPQEPFEREANNRKLEFLRRHFAQASVTWPALSPGTDAEWRERLEREVDISAWVGRSGTHYHNLMRAGPQRILLVKACRPETLRAAAERFRRDFRDTLIDILCRKFDPQDAPAGAGGRHLLMTRPCSLWTAIKGRYDAIVYCVNARVGFPLALRFLSLFLRAPVRLVTQDAFDPKLMDTPAGKARLRRKKGVGKRLSPPPPPASVPSAHRELASAVMPTVVSHTEQAGPESPSRVTPQPTPEEVGELAELRAQLPRQRPYVQEALLSLLEGDGIEMGALHRPVRLEPERARVFHVDRLSLDRLREHYGKNVSADRIDEPDIVCDGATLEPFSVCSLDFIIARHLLEHLPDPLGALIRWHELLRPGGLLFLSVPHRAYTFDKQRQRTTLDHLLSDYREPSALRDFDHYLEWAEKVNNRRPGGPAFRRATELVVQQYSIHYHVWEPADVEDIFRHLEIEGHRWHLVASELGRPREGALYLWMKVPRDKEAEWLQYAAARASYQKTGRLWHVSEQPAARRLTTRPDVSACVVNWNTKDMLRECLRSLGRPLHQSGIETIVVDNASTDGSVEMVAEEFPEVTVIANIMENIKFARGNNQAMLRARGRYILLVNSDIVVLPGAIDRMVAYLEVHRDVGMLSCKLVYPDGRPQNSCLNFPSLLTEFSDISGMRRRHPTSPFWAHYTMAGWNHEETRDVDQPMASCVLVRREVLDEVGYLDTRFPIYYNDVDWCVRIKRAGWRIVYFADAKVIHHRRASTDRLGAWRIVEHHLGKRKFFRKHFGAIGHALMWIMNMAWLVPHYLRLRLERAMARRRRQPFSKRDRLWETAKLLRVYLGLPLGR